MPYSIATDTISRINDLGRLIRDFDDTRDTAQKRADLQLAFGKACKVLVELATSEEELITAIDNLGDPIPTETLKKCSEMFWRLEELVLRDAGIDDLTREKILTEAKHFQNIVERNDMPAKGRSIAFDIRTA